ncbi:universal stress protein UspA [Stutzerimonas kirkiae]|uniref:Universal stress protein UspA n=1 Tax=Stutzerimonas kirkiae TaxID=2211392 RepID=A0A4Q9R5F9_9GAMM|nr:universal stress protein [Stutzerimonas kirkiae]TBU95717.1 universal stress protein UspA [Stutzerimonas kirkiae]TBV02708.1 universal stress protein UspA [Stutzerimonas kirkiae]
MSYVTACLDTSPFLPAVCDYVAWSCSKLAAPLMLLHVVDSPRYPGSVSLSGTAGLGGREHFLDELVRLDAQRSRVAREQGQILLESAATWLRKAGAPEAQLRLCEGSLPHVVKEQAAGTRLLVIGRQGEDSSEEDYVGSQLESVIRVCDRPILVVPENFSEPESVLLAYDGSDTARKALEWLLEGALCQGMRLHVLLVGNDSEVTRLHLDWARERIAQAGLQANVSARDGLAEHVLQAYIDEHDIDLLVMGAYGHSRIRRFLVGSTTTNMLHRTSLPLLLVR